MLKLVTAIVKPHVFDEVKEAMRKAGVTGITVTEVKGFGRQGGKTESFRGSEYTVELIPKIKLETIAEEESVPAIVAAVTGAARTGKIGDGKVWVLGIDELLRVRTGELGADAI